MSIKYEGKHPRHNIKYWQWRVHDISLIIYMITYIDFKFTWTEEGKYWSSFQDAFDELVQVQKA